MDSSLIITTLLGIPKVLNARLDVEQVTYKSQHAAQFLLQLQSLFITQQQVRKRGLRNRFRTVVLFSQHPIHYVVMLTGQAPDVVAHRIAGMQTGG